MGVKVLRTDAVSRPLRILALSPYDGGSHRQFLDGWVAQSEHEFTVLRLPPRHFKWRIRQASIGLAQEAAQLVASGHQFDLVWTTSMLDAAELRGLFPPKLRSLPLIVYFHENQLVYPVRKEDARNQHFSLINWATALAADESWFNSEFNRATLLDGLRTLLRKMPDHKSLGTLEQIRERSRVEPLGIHFPAPATKKRGPLHLAWVGRWEHDKGPDEFFAALSQLKRSDVPFRLSVLGQSFRSWPPVFDQAKDQFKEEIVHFGYAENRSDYLARLAPVDVVVSTAKHEFFGIALLEALGAGALPLVPDRLVYPELYPTSCLYGSESNALVDALKALSILKAKEGTLHVEFERRGLGALRERYGFSTRARDLDASLSRCHRQATPETE